MAYQKDQRGHLKNIFILFLISIVVFGFILSLVPPVPLTMDEAYYFDNARDMYLERPDTKIIWNYLTEVDSFKRKRFTYWSSGVSRFSLFIFRMILQTDLTSARIGSLIIMIVVILLVYLFTFSLYRRKEYAFFASILTLINPYILIYSIRLETYALYSFFLLFIFYFFYLSLNDFMYLYLSAIFALGAFYIRHDSILLFCIFIIIFFYHIRKNKQFFRFTGKRFVERNKEVIIGGIFISIFFLNMLLPFFYGSERGMLKLLYIESYRDMFSPFINTSLKDKNLFNYISLIVKSIISNLGVLTSELNISLIILIILFKKKNFLKIRNFMFPVFFYAIILFLFYSVVLPVIGSQGSFSRSSYALIPVISIMCAGEGFRLIKKYTKIAIVSIIVILMMNGFYLFEVRKYSIFRNESNLILAYIEKNISNKHNKKDSKIILLSDDPCMSYFYFDLPSVMVPEGNYKNYTEREALNNIIESISSHFKIKYMILGYNLSIGHNAKTRKEWGDIYLGRINIDSIKRINLDTKILQLYEIN